ncbi:hypothetical protein [Clostridium sp. FP1]|uniref:hypothetical protein n=1 Tax=Clostridium sp. FP1 TaxID=2724076 RepID=UPI0013E8FF37|nr:hypothetical protein [Clostridium sp. FP1]MBZ9633037.1 hypothetical protein [Clostridium sp. FP1]
MLRKKLENRVGHLSNTEFAIICGIVTDDLMFNRVNFKKHTSLNYVTDIAVRCVDVFRKSV